MKKDSETVYQKTHLEQRKDPATINKIWDVRSRIKMQILPDHFWNWIDRITIDW